MIKEVGANANVNGSRLSPTPLIHHSNALARESHLWTPHETWLQLGQTHQERSAAYRNLFAGHIDPDDLKKVRDAVNKRLALGNNRFRDEI